MSGGDAPAPTGRLDALASLTDARIGLGRVGASLPTLDMLAFSVAHARARDAVHARFRPDDLISELVRLGLQAIAVESRARTRVEYLRRPDLGRLLSDASRGRLAAMRGDFDLAIALGDGLSAAALHGHAGAFVAALLPHLTARSLRMAPVVVASQARVALGDQAAESMGARMVLMLIGERPGLSSPDSLGAYLTFAPRPGVSDAERNCVSNIRPGGLPIEAAAFRVAWLIGEAIRLSLTGVALKDRSEAARSVPRSGRLERG